MTTLTIAHPKIVSRDEWLRARRKLLIQERAQARRGEVLSANRRRLPMVRIEKPYVLVGPEGKAGLVDLFDGRRQLIVFHFTLDSSGKRRGQSPFSPDGSCPACSSVVGSFVDLAQLHARDTTLVLVSRAPLARLQSFKERMGWTVPWYSSIGSEFNTDFRVTIDEVVTPYEYHIKDKATLEQDGLNYHARGEQPGLSVFLRLEDDVFHTYSTFGRGLDPLILSHTLLDLTAYGRQEEWEDSPEGWPRTPKSPARAFDRDRTVDSPNLSDLCLCSGGLPG